MRVQVGVIARGRQIGESSRDRLNASELKHRDEIYETAQADSKTRANNQRQGNQSSIPEKPFPTRSHGLAKRQDPDDRATSCRLPHLGPCAPTTTSPPATTTTKTTPP